MKDTLKVAGRIGAELGAAKAEVERLREALRPFAAFEAVRSKQGGCTPKRGTAWAVASAGEEAEITVEHLQEAVAALSQQPEPTDTFTAVEMATAAAQGFRDGQAAVEQATAQDEREASRSVEPIVRALNASVAVGSDGDWVSIRREHRDAAVRMLSDLDADFRHVYQAYAEAQKRANRPAQTAPQGKFRMGDLVKKSTGSEWVGRVVGWYSTEQTKEGYAVESSAHRNSVQIYPAKALELVPMAAKEA